MPFILPKAAVDAAFNYLKELIPVGKISNVRIEELRPATEETKQFWHVVLSYDALGDLPFESKREYKEFKIDGESGLVISMTIKKV